MIIAPTQICNFNFARRMVRQVCCVNMFVTGITVERHMTHEHIVFGRQRATKPPDIGCSIVVCKYVPTSPIHHKHSEVVNFT